MRSRLAVPCCEQEGIELHQTFPAQKIIPESSLFLFLCVDALEWAFRDCLWKTHNEGKYRA
jgi:hypothetical protein